MNGEAIPAMTTERCPRCGAGFHCGMNDAGPCACAGLALPARLQAQLRARYTGCLCVRCLAALAADAAALEAAGLAGEGPAAVSAAPATGAC